MTRGWGQKGLKQFGDAGGVHRCLSLAGAGRRLRVVGEASFEIFRAESLEVNVFL